MARDILRHPVVLTPTELAHFAIPKTWPEIFAIRPRRRPAEWRAGVIEADDLGRGLLVWTPGPPVRGRGRAGGTWALSEKGRAFVALHLGAGDTVH